MSKSSSMIDAFNKVFSLSRLEKKNQLFGFVFSIFASVLSIGASYTLKILIDDVLIGNQADLLWVIQVIFLILVLVQSIATIIKNHFFYKASNRILLKVRSNFVGKILSCDMNKLGDNYIGESLSTFNHDVDGIDDILSNGIPNFISSIVTIILTATAMVFLNFKLATLTLLIVPIVACTFIILQKKVKEYSVKLQNDRGRMNGIFQEVLNGLISIKALNIETESQSRVEKSVYQMQASYLKIKLLYVVMGLSSWVMVMVPFQAIMYGVAGTWYFNTGKPTIGLMLTFANFANSLTGPIISVVQFMRELTFSSVCFERIDTIELIESEASGMDELITSSPISIKFDKLKFAYDDNIILDNLCFKFEANQITSIYGVSGSGKSTILKLINKFNKYEEGEIFINQQQLSSINKYSLRNKFSYVPQTPYLFNGTIRDNLLLADQNASEASIRDSLEKVNLWEYVSKLSDGIYTQIGDKGSRLSGGQKQRLAIAQAILKKSKVILLDEPTSSLDASNSAEIAKLIKSLKHDCTIIVSTHDASIVGISDNLLDLDELVLKEKLRHNRPLIKDRVCTYALER